MSSDEVPYYDPLDFEVKYNSFTESHYVVVKNAFGCRVVLDESDLDDLLHAIYHRNDGLEERDEELDSME